MSIQENIGIADNGLHGLLPLIGVGSDSFRCQIAIGGMAIGVTCQDPAVIDQTLGNFLRLFYFFLVGFRAQCGFIRRFCPVTENTLVTGYTQYGPGTVVGKIGVLLNESLQNRNNVVFACCDIAVGIHIFAGRIAVFVDYQTAGKAVTLGIGKDGGFIHAAGIADHISVIVDIVLTEQERSLAFRKADASIGKIGVSAGTGGLIGDIIRRNKNIAPVIQFLQDRPEFSDCNHVEVVAILFVIAVKCPVCIYDQGVEEQMTDVVKIRVGHQFFVFFGVFFDLVGQYLIFFVFFKAFQKGNSTGVVVARG